MMEETNGPSAPPKRVRAAKVSGPQLDPISHQLGRHEVRIGNLEQGQSAMLAQLTELAGQIQSHIQTSDAHAVAMDTQISQVTADLGGLVGRVAGVQQSVDGTASAVAAMALALKEEAPVREWARTAKEQAEARDKADAKRAEEEASHRRRTTNRLKVLTPVALVAIYGNNSSLDAYLPHMWVGPFHAGLIGLSLAILGWVFWHEPEVNTPQIVVNQVTQTAPKAP